jgi:glycosyltransferase involved in cell wall biosynthesis
MMKVLLCHTYYTQRGGEDCCFEEERDLLRAHGHEVIEFVRYNDALCGANPLRAAITTLWNHPIAREVRSVILRERPAVVHCTNTFPLLSPAVCYAANRAGAPVVQALHNYRWLCAGAYLVRDGAPCEDCVTGLFPWSAIRHRCYRNSAAASAVVAAMQVLHRRLGRWVSKVDAFYTLTEFAKQRFVEGGFPSHRIHVKANSVNPDPGPGLGDGKYIAFVGRLSPEKGVATALAAWRQDKSLPRLKVVGDGPLATQVREAAAIDPRIEWLGRLPMADVHRVIGAASALLMPSVWYETFGRTIAEAYASGTPVIASNLGAIAELVVQGETGWLFTPGNPLDLAAKVQAWAAASPAEAIAMRMRARREYEHRFTPAINYERLIEIYACARARSASRRLGLPASATLASNSEAATA